MKFGDKKNHALKGVAMKKECGPRILAQNCLRNMFTKAILAGLNLRRIQILPRFLVSLPRLLILGNKI